MYEGERKDLQPAGMPAHPCLRRSGRIRRAQRPRAFVSRAPTSMERSARSRPQRGPVRSSVVDRLRLFWTRPLRDSDRPRLFAIAVALIAAAAAMLTQVERRGTSPRVKPPGAPPAAGAPESALTPAASFTPAEPSEEGTRSPVAVSQADVAASKQAARRFLARYLPYTYGRGRARRIRPATAGLRHRLVAQRPRVSGGGCRGWCCCKATRSAIATPCSSPSSAMAVAATPLGSSSRAPGPAGRSLASGADAVPAPLAIAVAGVRSRRRLPGALLATVGLLAVLLVLVIGVVGAIFGLQPGTGRRRSRARRSRRCICGSTCRLARATGSTRGSSPASARSRATTAARPRSAYVPV